jgi:chemotaxis response regulator CheB
VCTVTDHAPLENGVVFVVPANRHVEITDHAISLRTRDGGRAMPSVDLLLTTAAPVFGENLIAVILSGTGSDGATGARAVKEAGGMVVTAQDGLGVGLFITRELVRAHGSAIEVRSTAEEGATFTVRLPLLLAPDEVAPDALGDAVDTQGHQP